MGKRWKVLLSILVATFCMAQIGAQDSWTFGISGGSSWYMGYGKYKDDLPFRSSVTAEATAAIGYSTGRWEFDGFFNYNYVSASPLYAGKRRNPFNGFGGGARISYLFANRFSVFTESALMYNFYMVDEAFISAQLKAGPHFTLVDAHSFRLALDVPIGVEFRKDVTALTLGVRCQVNYDIKQKKATI